MKKLSAKERQIRNERRSLWFALAAMTSITILFFYLAFKELWHGGIVP